jgi:hypothetical protein
MDAGRSDTRSAAIGDRERLIELACNVANIISITGEEEGIAKSLLDPLASQTGFSLAGCTDKSARRTLTGKLYCFRGILAGRCSRILSWCKT